MEKNPGYPPAGNQTCISVGPDLYWGAQAQPPEICYLSHDCETERVREGLLVCLNVGQLVLDSG